MPAMTNGQLDRRTFLTATIAACATCPLASVVARDAAPADPVDVGTAADYPRDGAVYDAYARSHGFFLVRDGATLYALGSTCTHKKALLKVKGAALACPKHGARFKTSGDVAKGPARRPLPRFGITRDDAGRITVDPSRTFDAHARDDEGSSIRID